MARKSTRARPTGHAAPRPTVDDMLATRSRLNKASADFLKIDLDTALMFTTIAFATNDREKRERNRNSARKAYDTVIRLMRKVILSEREMSDLSARLEQLKSRLLTLGEVF